MTWLEYGGRLRKLPDGTTVVGSGAEASLPIEDADLMPRHFILHPRAGQVEVAAFSSDVVVCVSGQQIGTEAWPAAFGEPIQAGSGEFRVWAEQPSPGLTPPQLPPRAYLVNEQEGIAYPLDRLVTSIGRSSATVVRLADPTASRFHAQIRREAGGFAVHVTGSAGGTINGRRIPGPRLLVEGDQLELAYTTLRFTSGPVPEGVRVVPVSAAADPAATERPTMAKDRSPLGPARPPQPPGVLRTALVLGVATALAAAAAALAILR